MCITIQVLGIGAGAEHAMGLSRWVVQPRCRVGVRRLKRGLPTPVSVYAFSADSLRAGLADSFARPGRNVTAPAPALEFLQLKQYIILWIANEEVHEIAFDDRARDIASAIIKDSVSLARKPVKFSRPGLSKCNGARTLQF
jgi:hypothetical protein